VALVYQAFKNKSGLWLQRNNIGLERLYKSYITEASLKFAHVATCSLVTSSWSCDFLVTPLYYKHTSIWFLDKGNNCQLVLAVHEQTGRFIIEENPHFPVP